MSNLKAALIFTVAFFGFIALGSFLESSPYRNLKDNPKIELHCHFKDGWQHVPTHRVIGLEGQTWQFDNGYAKRCKLQNATR